MNEILIAWLPVIVSTVCTTAIGITIKTIVNKVTDKIVGNTKDAKNSALEAENKANMALEQAKELNNKSKELLAMAKDEREANNAILQEMRKINEEMSATRNEMRTIRVQNTRDLRSRR